MAKATGKSTLTTTLVIGQVEVPVSVFSATVDKPGKPADFDTGGPNGGKLMARAVAKATPVEEVPVDAEPVGVKGDPLAEQYASTIESAAADDPALSARLDAVRERVDLSVPAPEVAGEYGRELVEDGSGVVVAPQDVRRGVRLEDGRFIDCTEQLAEIDERTKLDTMTVVGFVDVTQIPRAWAKGAKYLGAGDESAPHALRIVFEGLKNTRRAAIVKLTKRSRQTLGAIVATRGVLMLYELVWREDFREPPARAKVIQQAAVHAQEVEMFEQLVGAMSMPAVALDDLRDDAIRLREELKLAALAGEVPEVLEAQGAPAPDEVLSQLERSLAAVGP